MPVTMPNGMDPNMIGMMGMGGVNPMMSMMVGSRVKVMVGKSWAKASLYT